MIAAENKFGPKNYGFKSNGYSGPWVRFIIKNQRTDSTYIEVFRMKDFGIGKVIRGVILSFGL